MKEHRIEESKDLDDTLIIEEEGTKDPFRNPKLISNTMSLSMKSLNLSFIKQGVELFTFNIISMNMSMLSTETEQIIEMAIDRMQLDNMAEMEPLFPVVLKPRCTGPETEHNHESMVNVKPLF